LIRFAATVAVIVAGTATLALAAEGDAAPIKTQTMWDLIKSGGPVLLLLAICSVFTLTIIIERFTYYRKAGGSSEALVEKVKAVGTMSEALVAVENAPGVSGRIFRKALEAARDGHKPDRIEQLVQGEVTKELIGLEKFLPQLDTMVTMCPLLGLAGTTIGMIRSFSIVAAIGMSDPTKLAGGISEALVNTAAGLLIAIPSLFCYNWFTGKKEAMLMDLEKGLSELMVLLKSSADE
jgi:biopolymer transport protein ExbB